MTSKAAINLFFFFQMDQMAACKVKGVTYNVTARLPLRITFEHLLAHRFGFTTPDLHSIVSRCNEQL